jgi:hypothetical protein
MRKLLLASSVALATSLGGCATTGGGGAFNLNSFIANVQADTNLVCAFIPTAETVANIFATGDPIVTTATAVANAICAAVAPKTAGALKRSTVPTVAGVVIHGRFTGPHP